MPIISTRLHTRYGRLKPGPRRHGPALAIALGLVACVPVQNAATKPGGPPPPGTAPATAGPAGQPHPVALAPSLTGAPPPAHATVTAAAPIAARPLPPPSPPPAAAVAAVHPAPPPPTTAPAAPAPPPAATAAAAVPRAAPPGKPCPPGTVGMWSPPDVIGQSVYICRLQAAPRP